MLKILEELYLSKRNFTLVSGTPSITADENRLTGYFFSDTIFNFTNSVFSDNEINRF